MPYEPKWIQIKNNKYTIFHLVVFILTFFGYSLFHAARKTFSNVKTTVSEEWRGTCDLGNTNCSELKPDYIWNEHTFFTKEADAKLFLGELDAIFLAAYSIGLFISGILGDHYNLRYVLTIGMLLSAISMFMFGVVSEWFNIYNQVWYISFWIINGFAQSTGWPGVVAVMGNWFGKSGRGLIFGIWSANASVGNIFGALMAASVLKYGYHYAFILSSSVMFAAGIVMFYGLVPSPKDVGLELTDSDDASEQAEPDESSELPLINNPDSRPKAIGFFQALLLPGVIMYSLCYAFLKMVNYSFLFWLPFYLSNNFKWTESDADQISIWYDIGGIFGGIIGGYISDLIQKRSVVIVTLLTLAIPSLYIYSDSPDNKTLNALLMTIVGFFIGGAAGMISGTVTADLGKQEKIKGSKEALSTVTGIVDGTGSIGAAVGQLLVPVIQQKFNWYYVFYLFIILCIITNLCIVPLFIRETRELIARLRQNRANIEYNRVNADDIDE